MSRFEHMVNATQLSCVSIWTLGCYATVLCLSIWTHGECYATVLRNCLASLDLNTWCVLRNCLVSRFEHLDATQLSCVSRFEHMVNATQLSYATVLRLSIWTHGCVLRNCLVSLDLNTWMLRHCLVFLDLNTWWMLRNCLVSLDLNTWMLRNCLVFLDLNTWWMLRNCLVPRFQRMDATQLSCVSRYFEKLNIDLMLRQHYECAICAVICTLFITSLLSDLSVPCNYDMCIWYPYFNFFSVFIYFRACHNRSE